jgi:sporadic carbohydrate cluster 2OG-Fe(II) oxygenase
MMTKNLLEKGFDVILPDDVSWLEKLRSDIYCITKSVFNLEENDPESGFNNFHKSISHLSSGEINNLRIKLINQITANCDSSELVYKAFEQKIGHLLGPDILAQKTCNIVIQPPGDPNPSEIHRDAPLNSPYEVVIWVPLVDCYATKTMYILDERATDQAFLYLEKNKSDWTGFENYAKSMSVSPRVPFGTALFFHTGLLHGSEINQESETRVSLNLRYKNIFSPSGLKNQLQFFKLLRSSAFSQMGARLEERELNR